MEIKTVTFKNFKPYYGDNTIDLSVNNEQNIILIGGRNGQGKTSFLVGLVWCFYGKMLTDIDNVFKKEVQDKGNYAKYLKSALNWTAKEENEHQFSVSVLISNVELAEGLISEQQKSSHVRLTRTYNIFSNEEKFEILIDEKPNELIEDERDKANFINNYLIPLNAAKFVFFDAEKIAEIADLSLAKQGQFMNDALSKILGLGKYEDLIEDLITYRNTIKESENTKNTTKQRLNSYRGEKAKNENDILVNSSKKEEIEENIASLTKKINAYERTLAKHGAKNMDIDVDALEQQKGKLENEKQKYNKRLNEIALEIPFAIAAGKLQEVVEHLEMEEEEFIKQNNNKELDDKAQRFLDELFNHPPFPENDIHFKKKIFYYDKGEKILKQIYSESSQETNVELPFYHHLGKATKEHIYGAFSNIQRQSNEVYQDVFNNYIRIDNEINQIKNQLRKARANAQDESIAKWKAEKESAEKEKYKKIKELGSVDTVLTNLENKNKELQSKIENLLNKIQVSKEKQPLIDDVNQHLKVLKEFVEAEKESKCHILEAKLLTELAEIMHKKELINSVSIDIIADKGGLDVTLYDDKEQQISKNLLSSGEKQIYISALLKAILSQAVTKFPIFIDTPLARLDSEHKDNFVNKYYPRLANQVIIFSTNEEVTVKRKNGINRFVANTYLLENENKQTKIYNRYF